MIRAGLLLLGLLALAVSYLEAGQGVLEPRAAAAATPVRIGSIADSRFGTGWTLDGASMTKTRAKLLGTGLFTITDVSATLNQSSLVNFDIFFIGWLTDSSPMAFTPAELVALQAWMNSGGMLIVTCDDPSHDAVCAFFGYPVLESAVNPMKPAASHSIFSGPYGSVTSFQMGGNQGYFTTTSGATLLAVDSSTPPRPIFLERRATTCSDLILFSDVNIISQSSLLSDGTGFSTDNDKVLGNLFAYAGGIAQGCQAPKPNVSGAIGAIVAGADGTRDNLARQAQAQGTAQQAAASAATAAQQAAQPSGLLRPPSTGDAGLVGQDSARQDETALLMAAIALTLIAATVVRGRLRAQRH